MTCITSCGMSFGAGMKFRKPFRPNTRNISPNRVRTMAVTMRLGSLFSSTGVSTVCDAVSDIACSFQKFDPRDLKLFAVVDSVFLWAPNSGCILAPADVAKHVRMNVQANIRHVVEMLAR